MGSPPPSSSIEVLPRSTHAGYGGPIAGESRRISPAL
jgi:hypothetical protein